VLLLEIDEKRIWNEERIETLWGDQSNFRDIERCLKTTGTDIDFVVDDGSHRPDHQIFTCLYLMPRLNKDATYIIEDVNINFADVIMGSLGRYRYHVPSLPHHKRTRDNRLIVVNNYGV